MPAALATSYDGWDPTALANALRAFAVETGQVWGRTQAGEGANRRGVARQAVLDAIAARPPRATNRAAIDVESTVTGRPALAPGAARSSAPDSDPDEGTSA